jgi:hypothetical protein
MIPKYPWIQPFDRLPEELPVYMIENARLPSELPLSLAQPAVLSMLFDATKLMIGLWFGFPGRYA